MQTISCIIPAYNEASRIGSVLEAIIEHPLLNEIIVVDDHSSDKTLEKIRLFPNIKIIAKGKNEGKSKAVYDGIKQSTGTIILLLDADLIGLTPQNITDLITPVLMKKAQVSMSLRKCTPWVDSINKKIGFDWLSGERVFERSLIQDDIERIQKLRGFGLEVFLNRIIIKKKCPIKIVAWNNVQSPVKFKKFMRIFSLRSDTYITVEILRSISIFEILYQYIQISKLKIKE